MSFEQARIIFGKAAAKMGLPGGNFDDEGLLTIRLQSQAVPRVNIAYLPAEDGLLVFAPTAEVPENIEGLVYRHLLQKEFLYREDHGIIYSLEPESRILTVQLRIALSGLSGEKLSDELSAFVETVRKTVIFVLTCMRDGDEVNEDEYRGGVQPDSGDLLV